MERAESENVLNMIRKRDRGRENRDRGTKKEKEERMREWRVGRRR